MKAKLIFTTLSLCAALLTSHVYAKGSPIETLYTLSNDPSENSVLAFQRDGDGYFEPAGEFFTGGVGTGGGLGNQGALALSKNSRYLFAVNAGSDEVSVFSVHNDGLELLDTAEVVGDVPVSVTADHNLVYVVNAGDDSISGLRFDPYSGKLYALPGSHQYLSTSGTAPAQISFNPQGDTLAVTEKGTNTITTFAVDENGLPSARYSIGSAGITPFGFEFGKHDQFFVSEANGVGNGAGATVSSYEILPDGSAQLIDGAIAVNQMAACWLTTTPNGRIAFTANTPAKSISTFAIDSAGNMSLLETIAATAENPRDMAMSNDGKILFTLNGGDNTIGVYKVSAKGKLHKMQEIENLPAGFTGLIVR